MGTDGGGLGAASRVETSGTLRLGVVHVRYYLLVSVCIHPWLTVFSCIRLRSPPD